MLKSNFRRIILFAIAVTLSSLMAVFALPQREASKQPIHKEGLINALKQLHRGDSQADVVGQVRLRGVDFELTPAIEKELRGAGASSEMIEAIRANYRPPVLPRTAANETKNSIGMQLVYVPPGSFMMGSTNGGADEKPVHQVTISRAFYMGKYEVTQAQWQGVMGNNPSLLKYCGGDCPVESVSWNDAQKFIQRLNETNDGYVYRLPTETEWEYACRAGTTGDYAGNLSDMAWYSENAGSKTHAVGGKQPNAWGLADMHGNVWEWCEDWYHPNYDAAPTDGSAWLSGGEMKRLIRGGGFHTWEVVTLRSAYRGSYDSAARGSHIGFRVVAVTRTQ